MMVIRTLLALVFVFHSLSAVAGPISDTFSDSVFGVKWMDDVETVKRKFPGGKLNDDHGFLIYEVRDGRKILKTTRTDKDKIIFTFDAVGKLNGVGVEFPYDGTESFGNLLNKMTTYFGTYDNDDKNTSEFGVNIVWPTDNNIKLTLAVIPGILGGFDIMMGIGRIVPVKASKNDLGF